MSTAAATTPSPANPQTSWLDAWIDLHIRPSAFFAGAGRHLPMVVPILVVGFANIIDRIDWRMVTSELRGAPLPQALDWREYWMTVLLGGCLSGPIAWLLFGWWVRQRARFCGASNPNRDLCRRIAILTSCISALPVIVIALIQTTLTSSPVEWSEAPDFTVLGIGTLYWSVYASYRAVCTRLDVRVARARFWFLILPGGFYALVLGGIIATYARAHF